MLRVFMLGRAWANIAAAAQRDSLKYVAKRSVDIALGERIKAKQGLGELIKRSVVYHAKKTQPK